MKEYTSKNPPRINRAGESPGDNLRAPNNSNIWGIRGIIYEEDPVKLQAIMDETDRKREALRRERGPFWMRP